MKIDNYDSEKSSKDIKRKLVDFISEDYRMLICGPSGCGKTNVLMHILQKPRTTFRCTRQKMKRSRVLSKGGIERLRTECGKGSQNRATHNISRFYLKY